MGYKKANPELKPETIINLETGENIEVSGGKKKPVLQKRNISKVEIYGFEASLHYQLLKQLNFTASYTFNHSTIKEFYDEATATDFEGKYLIEVPKHQYSFAAYWKNEFLGLSAIYNYMDKQWFDDLNTEYIEAYHVVDVKASMFFTKNLSASWIIQNLFDNDFIDCKGLLSPGRFFLFEMKYKF